MTCVGVMLAGCRHVMTGVRIYGVVAGVRVRRGLMCRMRRVPDGLHASRPGSVADIVIIAAAAAGGE
jgi:hypothetical protein